MPLSNKFKSHFSIHSNFILLSKERHAQGAPQKSNGPQTARGARSHRPSEDTPAAGKKRVRTEPEDTDTRRIPGYTRAHREKDRVLRKRIKSD